MSESKFTALPTFTRVKKTNKPKTATTSFPTSTSTTSATPIALQSNAEKPLTESIDISSLSLNTTPNTSTISSSAIATLLPTIDTTISPSIRARANNVIITVNPSRAIPVIERSIVSLPVPFNTELYGSNYSVDPKHAFSALSPDDMYVEARRVKTLSSQ